MKKLILASAIAAITASTVATAADVYTQDDLTVSIDGNYEVQIIQEIGENESGEVSFDDLEVDFGVNYKLGNGMVAFGNIGLDYAAEADDSVGDDEDSIDTAYVGLKVGGLSTSVGRQYWASDDFGVEKSYEFDGGDAFPETGGSDTVKFEYAASNYSATLAHDFEEDDESATELFISTKLGSVDLGAVYQDYKSVPGADSVETYGIMASADIGKANVGIDYSDNDTDSYTNVAVGFPIMPKTQLSVGATYVAVEGTADVVQYYGNVKRNLNSNVSVFAEIGDNDKDASDLGYLAGMKIAF
jgi:predicted porin